MTRYTLVEYMPACFRASHTAARNSGTFPQNGAERAWVEGTLDESQLDPVWTRIIETADALPDGAELWRELPPDAYRGDEP